MVQIVEVSEDGAIVLPPDVLSQFEIDTKPHTRYSLQVQGDKMILTRLDRADLYWATTTPEERARNFLEWASRQAPGTGPGIPDEALRRENMYD